MNSKPPALDLATTEPWGGSDVASRSRSCSLIVFDRTVGARTTTVSVAMIPTGTAPISKGSRRFPDPRRSTVAARRGARLASPAQDPEEHQAQESATHVEDDVVDVCRTHPGGDLRDFDGRSDDGHPPRECPSHSQRLEQQRQEQPERNEEQDVAGDVRERRAPVRVQKEVDGAGEGDEAGRAVPVVEDDDHREEGDVSATISDHPNKRATTASRRRSTPLRRQQTMRHSTKTVTATAKKRLAPSTTNSSTPVYVEQGLDSLRKTPDAAIYSCI